MTPVARRRARLLAAWLAASAWEAVPAYLAFMRHSENPSPEVAAFLAASVCWIPVVGTAAAVMSAVWAWDIAWWAAVALYLSPRLAFVAYARSMWRSAGG